MIETLADGSAAPNAAGSTVISTPGSVKNVTLYTKAVLLTVSPVTNKAVTLR